MRQWVNQLWKPVCKEEMLLVLDEHRAQMTEEFKRKLQELSSTPVFVPGGCTSLVQPVDVVFNAPFKAAVEKIAQKHMLDNLDLYVHGKFTASERRVLLSKWIGEAWEKVCTKPELITRGFRKCRISIAVDGSEDEVIKLMALMTTQLGPSSHQMMMMMTLIVNQVKKAMLKIVL